MKNEKFIDTALQTYKFKKDSPIFINGSYHVFNGTQKQTNLPVTIKIIQQFHPELPAYLKKIKQCKSDNVIKVYEVLVEGDNLLFVTQTVRYYDLRKALMKCERLNDQDSIFVIKMLLNGYIDLLRSACNWFGTEQDIEFTEGGIKLSWNNSITFSLVNPFPKILANISQRPQDRSSQQNLLPFPKNKIIEELIQLSKQNASQISLHPQIKKKEKFAKKKQRNWLGLKETKNKNEYFTEIVYFAISEKYGFVRVKVYDSGKINKEEMALNKNKSTFARVLEYYEENGKVVIISEYSNDGNLQFYVNKIKNAGITLTEEHIEFFFYSMFDPLKQVQDSSLKSINLLNIRNIYIENGIPKIGEPIPMNNSIREILIDRADVPDFFHFEYKKNPSKHEPTFDTYSLGVLLYKLMFTEYPIFPNGLVHIPTTPSFSKRLKKTLQIFLNEGGKLKQIEKKIQVSENVVKQVKQNKQKLLIQKKQMESHKKLDSKRVLLDDQDLQLDSRVEKDKESEFQEENEDNLGCFSLCCTNLQLTAAEEAKNKNIGIMGLEESPYRIYRICTKMFITLLLYILLFYLFFLQNDVAFLTNQNLITQYNVTIATVNYPIITTDTNNFDNSFGTTSGSLQDFLEMKCLINNYEDNPNYSEQVLYQHSSSWVGFIATALIAMIGILIIKLWQIYNFDLIRVAYNRENALYHFNLANFIVFNLLWTSLLYGHFFFYNYVFNGQTQPCFTNNNAYASTEALFNDRSKFSSVYTLTFCLQIVAVILHCFMIGFTDKIKYNKIVNPIFMFCPLLIVQWLIIRLGIINGYFYPNAFQNSQIIQGYFSPFQYVNFLGTIPEILLIIQLLIGVIIDLVYWTTLDKRRRLLINETSAASLVEP